MLREEIREREWVPVQSGKEWAVVEGWEWKEGEGMDPLSKSSKPAHTTSPMFGWFGHVTVTMNSRHRTHELISRMSQDKPWKNC